MKLLVTGSRDGRRDVEHWLDRWLVKYGIPELVVLGDARGVDWQAMQWCKRHGLLYQVFVADWDNLGKAAGPARNEEMVRACSAGDHALGFPVGDSIGTYGCLSLARHAGLQARALPFLADVVNQEFDEWQRRLERLRNAAGHRAAELNMRK